MADEKKVAVRKGVVVEFDFAVIDGASILYKLTEKLMQEAEIPFSERIEAQYLAGGNYQGGLDEYFRVVKTKKTAQKAAKDLSDAFSGAVTEAIARSVTEDFKAFARALLAKEVKVVVATRADPGAAREAFAELADDPNFALYEETSPTYGGVKWDAWRRATASNRLRSYTAIAIPGSGCSAKGALLAGMGSIAVMNKHVEWQDFGGVDYVVDKLDASVADKVLSLLKC